MKHKPNYKKDFKKKPFKKKSFGRHDFYLEGNPEGVKVPDTNIYTLERALKYLKRQLKDSDKISKYRAKNEYIKPAQVRRKKKEEAIRSQQYKERIAKRNEKGYVWVAIEEGRAK